MASSGGGNTPRNLSGEDSDSDLDYENEGNRPRGLTGLQNLGNTCYLNSALQSLSNCPPLTQFFLDCPQLIQPNKSPMLSRSYLKVIMELWHRKRPSFVVPREVVTGIKSIHPMFRGYTQQDAQEFLRCLMDQLHEELKTECSDEEDDETDNTQNRGQSSDASTDELAALTSHGDSAQTRCLAEEKYVTPPRRPSFESVSSQSETDYETCDSGLSSERSYSGERDNSSDEDTGRPRQSAKQLGARVRKSSSLSSCGGEEYHMASSNTVANTKEMKETANLLEKNENEKKNRTKNGSVLESGDFKDQGSAYSALPVRDGDGQKTSGSPTSAGPAPPTPNTPPSSSQPPPKATSVSSCPATTPPNKEKKKHFESIISKTFDGRLLSSVRCLNCETVSTTKETFQDLSLPIPSKDHVHMLHSAYSTNSTGGGGVSPPKGGACGEVHQGWMTWMFSWMKSLFVGPSITLQDCLAAFFSADELKGDNMYSCEKCKKLRNGLKYSKVLKLPEVLCVHLKRFRHEFYSSKINTYISFPLENLDMSPYMQKGCDSQVTLYDLVAIICHHGTAGGGHYTAYCLNHLNGRWYEFDDRFVTEVDIGQVLNCEAYVLFYRKSNRQMDSLRQKIREKERNETSMLKFYISKQWLSRFFTFAEPGSITNKEFLCRHGGVPPGKMNNIEDLVVEIPQSVWNLLYNRFGGGPVCNFLYACKTCQAELDKLRLRQKTEKENFIQLNEEFQDEEHTSAVYAISMSWFNEWELFVKEKTDDPPGPIQNSRIVIYRNAQPTVRQNSDYGQLSRDMWQFLHQIYGGGPELMIRQATGSSCTKPASPTPPALNAQNPAPLGPASSPSSTSTSSPPWTSQESSTTSSSSQPSSSPVFAEKENPDVYTTETTPQANENLEKNRIKTETNNDPDSLTENNFSSKENTQNRDKDGESTDVVSREKESRNKGTDLDKDLEEPEAIDESVSSSSNEAHQYSAQMLNTTAAQIMASSMDSVIKSVSEPVITSLSSDDTESKKIPELSTPEVLEISRGETESDNVETNIKSKNEKKISESNSTTKKVSNSTDNSEESGSGKEAIPEPSVGGGDVKPKLPKSSSIDEIRTSKEPNDSVRGSRSAFIAGDCAQSVKVKTHGKKKKKKVMDVTRI